MSNKVNISGLRDLYKVTVDRHDDLRNMLQNADLFGEALRNSKILRTSSFHSKKSKIARRTAAAATMLHASRASEGFNLHIRQSLIAGIGLNFVDKEKVAWSPASTGRLHIRQLPYSQLESLQNEEWTGLPSIAVAVLCSDPNTEQSFETTTRRRLMYDCKLQLSNFKKPSEAS